MDYETIEEAEEKIEELEQDGQSLVILSFIIGFILGAIIF